MPSQAFRTQVGTDLPKTRKHHLSANALFALVRDEFGKVGQPCAANAIISSQDALMSGFAVFLLKDPALLAREARRQSGDPNLHRVYGIGKVPADTQMRERLDPFDPDHFLRPFKKILARIQPGKGLEQLAVLGGHYLLSSEGTSFFYSNQLSSDRCLTKNSNQRGKSKILMHMGKPHHQMVFAK